MPARYHLMSGHSVACCSSLVLLTKNMWLVQQFFIWILWEKYVEFYPYQNMREILCEMMETKNIILIVIWDPWSLKAQLHPWGFRTEQLHLSGIPWDGIQYTCYSFQSFLKRKTRNNDNFLSRPVTDTFVHLRRKNKIQIRKLLKITVSPGVSTFSNVF